ncbi:YIP1 family protein [Alphaproteobacteria bacterium GH1-50]|uniref:YIP1 family protein n=1 Tax=Kangsaoukella pontilimi TaxID=2691042 RepID=A0A7C9INU5_9RHOB|nr:YIP1 family protein [Kangsaoukella pontilimi]MXQ07590.1 YIP1 family protein [Kangsaoukella pontilimi]
MSVVLDIIRTYRAPREVLRRRLSGGAREDRALATLMAGCVLLFVAQWPRLSREAYLDETIGFDARLAGALFGWIFVMPLVFYVVAWVVHLVLRVTGSASTGYQSRMALFWAILASSPLWLLTGLMAGFVGPSHVTSLTGILALGSFFVFWLGGVAEIASYRSEGRV